MVSIIGERYACDKVVPECGQCHRTKNQCGGYKESPGLIFHDESSKVMDKSRATIKKRKKTSPVQEYPSFDSISPHSLAPEDMSLGIAAQSIVDYEGDGAFNDSDLSMDLFVNYQHPYSANDTLNPLYLEGFDSIIPGDASLESDARRDDSYAQGEESPGASHSRKIVNENHNGGDEYCSEITPNNQSTKKNNDTIARPFSLPLDMIGLNFFLSNYVLRESGPSSGFLDYTFAMLAHENGNELLEGAILALGFSGLARTTKQHDLLQRATIMYTRTKQRLNQSLSESKEMTKDNKIVTLLILALYEFSNNRSLESWKSHITVATSLLALRGKTQFNNSVGIQIFKDVFSHLLLICIYVAFPMPARLRILRIEAAEAVGSTDPYWIATGAAVEVLDLYQHIRPAGYSFLNSNPACSPSTSYFSSTTVGKSGTQNMSVEDLERHLIRALEIDQRLEHLSSQCSAEWRFVTKRNSVSESDLGENCVQGDIYHVYHDAWVANVWNLARICRVMSTHAIGHLVIRTANADGNWFFANQHADRLQQISKTMMSIRDDILASIPQLMGYVSSPIQKQHQQQQSANLKPGWPSISESHINRDSSVALPSRLSSPSLSPLVFDNMHVSYGGAAVGGYFACWALVIVGSLHCLGDEARAWIVAQLRQIGSRAVFDQAADFADCVELSQIKPPLSQ